MTICSVYKQSERKCCLLPVVNTMKFVQHFFQITVFHQPSKVVHQVMSDELEQSLALLSLSRSDVVFGGSVVLLTPCP